MNPLRHLKFLIVLAVLGTSGNAVAQASYNDAVIGATGLEGRRWGQGGRPGATMFNTYDLETRL
jgi:hypothetical protein